MSNRMKVVAVVLIALLVGCISVKIEDTPPCTGKRVNIGGYIIYVSCDTRENVAEGLQKK